MKQLKDISTYNFISICQYSLFLSGIFALFFKLEAYFLLVQTENQTPQNKGHLNSPDHITQATSGHFRMCSVAYLALGKTLDVRAFLPIHIVVCFSQSESKVRLMDSIKSFVMKQQGW